MQLTRPVQNAASQLIPRFDGQMGGAMGLLDGLMGNASEVDPSKIQTEFAQILTTDEHVEKAYQLIRDMFVFTNRRLVFVNRQGLTGSKVEYQSLSLIHI